MDSTNSQKLQAALTAAGVDPEALQKVAAAAIALVAEQETAIADAETFNSELQTKLDTITTGGTAKPTGTVGGKVYEVLHSVNYQGKVYKPADIAANADVLAALVAGNSTAIQAQATAEATE